MTSIEIVDQAARDTVESDVGRTLFVEAGAGTGKTTALVGRIVELVLTPGEHHRPLAQIAAITFTEAAAAELRERIRAAFENRLHQAREEGDNDSADRCEQALAEADVAAISTLHAFAQRLLSEFPVEVGIPPRVEVVDEVRSQLAFDQRWSLFLDALYDDPDVEEFVVRAAILGVGLNSSAMRNIAQAFEDNWDFLLGVELSTAPPTPIDTSAIREKIHQIRAEAQSCSDPSDKLLGHIKSAETTFARFDRADDDHEKLRLVRLLQELRFNNGRGANWDDVDASRALCRSLKDDCAGVLEAVTHDTLQRLAERIAVFTRESAEQRRSEGVLEFHDLLVLAHQLLRESPTARASLSERYRVLMLDEFQDTDPIQISMATLLAASVEGEIDTSWSEIATEPGRLFFVGDPKQSIYRFRRADIELFLQAAVAFGDGGVALQQNFRTVSPVIDMVNAFFATLMPGDIQGQADYRALVPFRQPSSADHRPLVFGAGAQGSAAEIREAEARDVAAIIEETRQDPQRWLVHDDSDGWRAPKLSDITILLPTRTSMPQLTRALDAQGIPFRADTGTLVYETQEIRDLLSVLRAIDDASDHISLAAALRSPLYGCGYDDLYEFVQRGGSLDLHGYVPDELADTVVASGIAHLRELAAGRWWDEPSALLQRVVDDRFAMALPAANRRARDTWRRIRYVIDQARAFAEAGGGDLRDYLAWTDLQGADGSRAHEPMLPEPDDEAVQIMTIHGSKGLEFPITIVSGMTTRVGGGRTVGEVKWGERGELPEVSISKNARTKFFDLRKELDDEMDGPERDRLLYVALTRARDHLAVSQHHALTTTGKPTPSLGLKVWEWGQGDDSSLVRSLEGVADTESLATESAHCVDAQEAPQSSESTPEADFRLQTPDAWMAAHATRLAKGGRRSAISATALARLAGVSPDVGDPADASDPAPPDLSAEDRDPLVDGPEPGGLPPLEFRRGRAGTAIGSAVHGVLQFLNLTDPSDEEVTTLSESQAWAESVPEHADTIAASVRAALSAPIVQSCATNQHWKELYVATPVGSMTVEGYVDLLVETSAGLVVVDYKTDRVQGARGVDAKLDQYRLQGAAYAEAVENATGQPVVDVQFVFCQPDGAIVRAIDDLDGARDQVRIQAERASNV